MTNFAQGLYLHMSKRKESRLTPKVFAWSTINLHNEVAIYWDRQDYRKNIFGRGSKEWSLGHVQLETFIVIQVKTSKRTLGIDKFRVQVIRLLWKYKFGRHQQQMAFNNHKWDVFLEGYSQSQGSTPKELGRWGEISKGDLVSWVLC